MKGKLKMDNVTKALAALRKRWHLMPLFIIVFALLVFRTSSAATDPAKDANFHLTILHTNDIHAHDEAFVEKGQNIGGLPRIGHLIRRIKKQEPDALVIDAGDIFQGTPLFTKYQGECEVHLLSEIGYDIYTIGNHEFDDGPENLANQLAKATFKIINCNMDCTPYPQLNKLISPYVIKEIHGQKVAFIGAIAPDLEELAPKCDKIRIKGKGGQWKQPIQEQIDAVKKLGINKIVLVTHCGVELDKDAGATLPDVDLIIGGHSHTRLDEAIVIPHADGSSTTIVQTGCYGRALGKLEVAFDDRGFVVPAETKYHLINITDKIFQDADLKAYVDEKVKPLLPLRRTIVGLAEGDFDNYFRAIPWDSPLGDVVADSLFEIGKSYGVQMAFENRGGIRSRIDSGEVTLEKIDEMLPFDNKLVFATITGECLRSALEHSVGAALGGRFFDEHGLKIAYDPQRPAGDRILFALVQNEKGEWHPVDPHAEYKIVVNNYSFDGGEGYNFKSATNVVRKADLPATAFRQYLQARGEIKPEPPSRIIPLTPGLLASEKSTAGDIILHVHGVQPHSRVSFICGTQQGITASVDKTPAPFADPHVLAHSKCNEIGQCDWKVSIADIKSALAASEAKQLGTNITVSAAQFPSDKQAASSAAGTQFSQPAELIYGKLMVSAIVEPTKSGSNKKAVISYPISIE